MLQKYLRKYITNSNWLCTFVFFTFVAFSFKTDAKKYSSNSITAINLYEQGAQSHLKRDYKSAIALLEKATLKDFKFLEAHLELATIYKELSESVKAENILDNIRIHVLESKDFTLQYEVTQLYYRIGAYLKAKAYLDLIYPQAINSKILKSKLQVLQQNLNLALENIQNSLTFNPQLLPAPLNQFVSQYFPILTVDQQTILFSALIEQSGEYKENIYISHKDPLGNWTQPKSISNQINQPNSNEGTCSISADKKTLVFSSCSRLGNYGICDLYISYKKDTEWSTPRNLGTNINSTIWQSQPSLSADGKTLYFVSERSDNYGKHDIWKSTLQANGEWTKAVNLGPVINSKDREVSPFIHPNGQTLFFASDRIPSMGGFDIYYTNFLDGKWTTPVNIGYPINNHKDQSSIFITPDGKKGYYADWKQQDFNYRSSSYLYEFDIPDNWIDVPVSEMVKIQVLDQKTQKSIVAQIEVYDTAEINACPQRIEVNETDQEAIIMVKKGKEYIVYINKEGHFFESRYIDFKNSEKPKITPDNKIFLHPVAIEKSKILEYIYFDYNDHTLLEKSHVELNHLLKFLQENLTFIIELEGHTDHIGSHKYNHELSIKRAKAAYDYLIQFGITSNRLRYTGYGKIHPLFPSNTPEHQQRNRRVAFKILNLSN